MKKVFLLCLLVFSITYASNFKLPQNITLDVCTVYVKQDTTVYTRAFHLSGYAWKVGMVAIFDTNLVAQDTIDIGDGVKIVQQLGFYGGNAFGRDSTNYDTLWRKCGDTTLSVFTNSEGLSSDSVICSVMDTAQMGLAAWGGDTAWFADGYFVLVPDPAPLTRFAITGAADFGTTMKQVRIILWKFRGVPVYTLQ